MPSCIVTINTIQIDLLGFTCSQPAQLSNAEILAEVERLRRFNAARVGVKAAQRVTAIDQALPLLKSGLGLVESEESDPERTVRRPAFRPADWLPAEALIEV